MVFAIGILVANDSWSHFLNSFSYVKDGMKPRLARTAGIAQEKKIHIA